MKKLIISLHDLHPASLSLVTEQRETLTGWGVNAASLLVVPRFHHAQKILESPETIAWCTQRQLRGDELVLHGCYHDRLGLEDGWANFFWNNIYTSQEAEFWDLNEMKARERLARGQALFTKCGWKLHGFIAPAWLMTPALPGILAQLGFTYTNTVRGLWHLQKEAHFEIASSLCWSTRAAWRRGGSWFWNEYLAGRLRKKNLWRMSLHPSDFRHVTIRKQIERAVKTALDAGFEPITYAAYAAR